jgi:uncharacterized protein YprB with RNaseH-like and TPR domain
MRQDSPEYFQARLREIVAKRRAGLLPDYEPPEAITPLAIEEVFPHGQVSSHSGVEYLHLEMPLDSLTQSDQELSQVETIFRELENLKDYPKEHLLFLDLETCGLTSAPIFLFGAITLDKTPHLVQGLARDYTEETALLYYMNDLLQAHPLLVTFNGKTYDLPFIKQRCIRHRMPSPEVGKHIDLLQLARRKFPPGILPNRRLITLEHILLDKPRSGDVPSHLIPALYHQFVKSGDGRLLTKVVRHNAYDVLAMLQLFVLLAG